MNKFEDYNASQITPQQTLLKKFNFLIKYLIQNPTYNVYYSSEDYSDESSVYQISNVVTREHELKSGDAIIFKNGYVGFTDAVGENTITIYNAISIIGPQGIQGETGPQGPQGIQGEQGPQGENGVDGSSVRILPSAESCVNLGDGYLDSNGHLQVLSNLSPRTFTDVGEIRGPQGIQGETGPQGPSGTNGTNGTDGISITNVQVNSSNHLIVTLSNNTTIDAGEIQVSGGGGNNGHTLIIASVESGTYVIAVKSDGTKITISTAGTYTNIVAIIQTGNGVFDMYHSITGAMLHIYALSGVALDIGNPYFHDNQNDIFVLLSDLTGSVFVGGND